MHPCPRNLENTQATNLAPVCVSRRLLSPEAYRQLALARQAGDPVKAGLTFVAEEEDEEDEENRPGEGEKGPGGAWAGVNKEGASGAKAVGDDDATAGDSKGCLKKRFL